MTIDTNLLFDWSKKIRKRKNLARALLQKPLKSKKNYNHTNKIVPWLRFVSPTYNEATDVRAIL